MLDDIKFVKSVFALNDLPNDGLPQIILCGRSNVGKSSFINSLFNKKGLAKTSSTPGKTRSLNYYLVDSKFYIVDLPGYGYAKTSLKEREYWGKFISDYLNASKTVFYAYHLIDSRHKPTELDLKLKELLTFTGLNYSIILNKVDKLKQSEVAAATKAVKTFYPELQINHNAFLYSAITKKGKDKIIKHILDLFK